MAAWIVPTVTIISTYVIGRLQASQQQSVAAAKERYEKLYLPFMMVLINGRYFWKDEYTRLYVKNKEKLLPILDKNVSMMGVNMMNSYLDFQRYNFNFEYSQKYGKNSSEYVEAEFVYNAGFENLVDVLLKEAEELSKKLKYPDLPGELLHKFSARKHVLESI